MSGLILPFGVKSTMPHPEDSEFRKKLFHRIYGDIPEVPVNIDDDGEKYRHAMTHEVANGWAHVKQHDGCPRCNGTLETFMQKEFEERCRKILTEDPLAPEAQSYRDWLTMMGKYFDENSKTIVVMEPDSVPAP